MVFRMLLPGFLLALVFARASSGAVLLNLDFNDASRLGAQAGTLPTGELSGDAKASSAHPGSIDLGQTGAIRIPGFRSPKGPYTVEARFLIRSYGPQSSNYIANILNTVPDHPQGLAFRVGGGYLYPPLPRNAFRTESEWQEHQDSYSQVARERLSDCFAVFVMAAEDGGWKEVYSDRCVEKDTWTHLVGTWDGSQMRLYINGSEATDVWRTQGPTKVPNMGDEVDAFVGSRTFDTFDPRHLDGALDFVKVEDGALTAREVHQRYRETFVPQVRDSLCQGMIIPRYPEAGGVCKGKLDLEFQVISHGACTDTAFIAALLAGDSVEIEIAKDPTFDDVVLRAVVSSTSVHIEADGLKGLAGYKGVIYWRGRILHAGKAVLAKATSAAPSAWSLSRPLVVDMSAVSSIRAPKSSLKPVLLQAGTGLFVAASETSIPPALFNLAGKRHPARFQRVTGGWKLTTDGERISGLFLLAP